MKRWIIILIILLIIVSGILITIIITNPNMEINKELQSELNTQEQEYIEGINNPGKITEGEVPKIVVNDNIYYTIDQCVKKYINYISEDNHTAIYSLLDNKYLNDNDIKQENIKDHITKYNVKDINKTLEMYEIAGVEYYTYYVKYKIGTNIIYFIINTDTSSKSFSVIPINNAEYEKLIIEPVKETESKENTIKNNEYNNISYKYYEQEDIAEKYLQDYLTNALLYPEEAYASLNNEYREKKFGNINGYKEYVNQNKEKLQSMCKQMRKQVSDFKDYREYEEYFRQITKNGLDKYKKESQEENIQYILTDTYGGYYIFSIKGVMQYTVILDTYTIDLPEFTSEYAKASDNEKVLMNVQRVFDAINDGDYKYAYSKLDTTFKNNNFKTLESFTTYMQQNFFNKNKVTSGKTEKQNDIYISTITINNENDATKKVDKSFVMQLKEGTDFVMSFNVN